MVPSIKKIDNYLSTFGAPYDPPSDKNCGIPELQPMMVMEAFLKMFAHNRQAT